MRKSLEFALSIACFLSGCGGGSGSEQTGTIDSPTQSATILAEPEEGTAPLSVSFEARIEGEPAWLLWDFGDGEETSGSFEVQHTYAEPGEFVVCLEVGFLDGTSKVATTVILVLPQEESCPDFADPAVSGTVTDARITECSGLAWSRIQPVLWLHNDSGDTARFFGVNEQGEVVAVVKLAGASARDWEDIAVGPDPEGNQAVFLADIGDNGRVRSSVKIYRVPEPLIDLSQTPLQLSLEDYDTIRLRYPDGPHDAETLLVDPQTGDIYILTKEGDGRSHIFFAEAPKDGEDLVLQEVGEIQLGTGRLPGSRLLTGGDISPDGSKIVLRTYNRIFVFLWQEGQSLGDALAAEPCPAPAPQERQGEAVAFGPAGLTYWTLSEGRNQKLYRIDQQTGK